MTREQQQERRTARRNVRDAKHSKGFVSGEKAAQVQQAIKNSRGV